MFAQGALSVAAEELDRPRRRPVPPAPAVLRRRQHEGLRGDPLPPAQARLRRGPPLRRRSPAWPISYEDLEPYYAQAERAATSSTARPARTPPSRERSGPFPYPAVSHEPRIEQLADDLARTGHQPFHLPVGVDLNESDPEAGRCVRCDRFDGFPCLTDGKADAHVRCVRPALEHPNVTLRRHAKVERLETDASGREVTSVVVDRRGVEERYSADVVVVSCGAVNSAALLLRSANDAHPRGLANASDVVGRHYMAHINSGVIAISTTPNRTRFQKTLGINDYYWGAEDFEYPLGHIQMLGKSDRNILRGGAPWFAPGRRARLHGEARDRLLADDRGPPPPLQPRHGRPPGPDPPRQGRPQHRAAPAPAREAQGPARRARLPGDGDPRLVGPRPAHPARRRRAPVRHGPLRDGPADLGARHRPAARTTSTTSTSSTRASSRPRAP